MESDLESRVQRLEEEVGIDTYDSPWSWFRPHRIVRDDAGGSGFDLGVDINGQPLIHRNGYVKTIGINSLRNLVEECKEVRGRR